MVAKGGGVFTAWPQDASEACATCSLQAVSSQNKKKMIDVHSPFTLPHTELYYGVSSGDASSLRVRTHHNQGQNACQCESDGAPKLACHA